MTEERLSDEQGVIRLDDLYRMTAHIYSEQSAGRSAASTYMHFVEVCGLLTSVSRLKPRGEKVEATDALCKSLGWFFPLMAQMGVGSIEKLVFRKFPRCCPYCLKSPHDDEECKSVKGWGDKKEDRNHAQLRHLYANGYASRPASIEDWQEMFKHIYPRSKEDAYGSRSALGLFEEICELAEAIKAFEKHPKYFLGEAADVFSYLMGIGNEIKIRAALEERGYFHLETEYLQRYPGICLECGYPVCRCPHVPQATLGRMSKELDIEPSEALLGYGRTVSDESEKAMEVSNRVFRRVGGFSGLIERFPFDRGAAQSVLIRFTLDLAEKLRNTYPEYADSLQRNALRLAKSTTMAGERAHSTEAAAAIKDLQDIMSKPDVAPHLPEGDALTKLVLPQSKKNILIVASAPSDKKPIRTDAEFQAICHVFAQTVYRDSFSILPPLTAPTIDDILNALANNAPVAILHLAGHGDEAGFFVQDESGHAKAWVWRDLAEYLRSKSDLECVVFNVCSAPREALSVLTCITVFMNDEITDDLALEFSKGFYSALGSGYEYRSAAFEACRRIETKGLGHVPVAIYPDPPDKGLREWSE